MANAIRLFIFSNKVLLSPSCTNQLFIRLKYSIAFGLNSINVLPYEKGPSHTADIRD